MIKKCNKDNYLFLFPTSIQLLQIKVVKFSFTLEFSQSLFAHSIHLSTLQLKHLKRLFFKPYSEQSGHFM